MKTLFKKLKTLAVAGMTMGLAALPAQAETLTNVKYIDADGVEQTCPSATLVTSSTSSLTGWYVVTGSVSRTRCIVVSGEAHLILADGCSLTVSDSSNAPITVKGEGNSLAIYGQSADTGKLTATGDSGNAGIGGAYDGSDSTDGSNITINGGVVTAKGGLACAGIGGGFRGKGSNITINGGTVTATGCMDGGGSGSGDGIGNGYEGSGSSNIKVNPRLSLRAGSRENPLEEIATDRTMATDVAESLKGLQYVTAAIDYMIVLENGEAYARKDNYMTNITARVASMGLTYSVADSAWTMNNFVFKTSHYTGLRAESGTVITLVGTNTIKSGISIALSIAVDIDENVTFQGDGVLNATAADISKARGLMSEGPFTVSGNACVMAKGNMRAVEGMMTEPDATAVDAVTGEVLTWAWNQEDEEGVYKNAQGQEATYVKLTSKPSVQIPSEPTEIENATLAVYTNGVLSADGTVWSNGTATVVYTANAGYYFADGATVVTNKLDTSVNPAVNKDVPSSPTINYTLVLANGKVRKNSASGADITATIAGMGLSYSGGAWTMNNFNFTTTATCAMKIQGSEETTIVVSGANSLTGGAGKGDVMALYTSVKTNLRGDGSLTVTAGEATELYKSNYGVYVDSHVSIQGITFTANGGDTNSGYSNGMFVKYGSGSLTVTAGAKVNAKGQDYGLQCGGNVIVEGTGSIKGTSSGNDIDDYGIGGYTQPQAVAKDESGNELTWSDSNYAYTDAAGNAAKTVILTGPTPVVMLGKIAQRYPWNGMLDIQYKTQYAGASCKVTFFADGKELGTAPGTGGQSATASFDLNTVADGAFKGKSLKGVQITATIE